MADLYVMTPVIRLFPHLNPATRNAAVVADEAARWREGLGLLAHYLPDRLPDAEAGLTMADCALMPALHLSTRIAAMLGFGEDPITPHAGLIAYYRRMLAHPVIGRALTELTDHQQRSDSAAGRVTVEGWHAALAAGAAAS